LAAAISVLGEILYNYIPYGCKPVNNKRSFRTRQARISQPLLLVGCYQATLFKTIFSDLALTA
jgi:hypothetical protein